MTTTIVCPACHKTNMWNNNQYKPGIFFYCVGCSVRLQHVFCPHCSFSNIWSNPKISAEGQVNKCTSCFKSFRFICCPHCEGLNMRKNGNYEAGLLCHCDECSRPFQPVKCGHCSELNAYPTATCIQGRPLVCRACHKMHQHVRCPQCKRRQVWKNCDYTPGTAISCYSCKHSFAFGCCPHCGKANFRNDPLNTPISFICFECKKDMPVPPIHRSSVPTPQHWIKRSPSELNPYQPRERSVPGRDGATRHSPRATSPNAREHSPCSYFTECKEFVKHLGWHISFFNMKHDRCYCEKCYPKRLADTLRVAKADYVLPRGWAGFGLGVDPFRGDHLWHTWIVVYHGTTAIAAQSILTHREFLLPGDHLINGTTLEIRSGHIPGKVNVYTSPSIRYASLNVYSPMTSFKSPKTGKRYNAQIVLQCKQKPGTFNIQEETVGWGTNAFVISFLMIV